VRVIVSTDVVGRCATPDGNPCWYTATPAALQVLDEEARMAKLTPGTYYLANKWKVQTKSVRQEDLLEARPITNHHHPVVRGRMHSKRNKRNVAFGAFATAPISEGDVVVGNCNYLAGGLLMDAQADCKEFTFNKEYLSMDYDMELPLPHTQRALRARGNPLCSVGALINDYRNDLVETCSNRSGRRTRCSGCQTFAKRRPNVTFTLLALVDTAGCMKVAVGIRATADIEEGDEILWDYGSSFMFDGVGNDYEEVYHGDWTATSMVLDDDVLSRLPKRTKYVDIADVPLTQCNLKHIALCENLSELSLVDCGLTDIKFLAGLRLTKLNLSGNPLHDISPLAKLKADCVDISCTRVVDIEPLAECESLSQLDLGGLDLGGLEAVVACLVRCKGFMDTERYAALSLWKTRLRTRRLGPLKEVRGLSILWVSKGMRTEDMEDCDDLGVYAEDPRGRCMQMMR
jgi:hypothetical protein